MLRSYRFLPAILMAALSLSLTPLAAAQDETKLTDLPAGLYDLDLTHASLTWRVKHMGLSLYTARFTDFAAGLTLDPDDIESSGLDVVVQASSVQTDYPLADKKDWNSILGTDSKWFDGKAHPEITFKATKIAITGDDTGTITGDLTLRGETHPFSMDVTFIGATTRHPFRGVAATGFSAVGTLDRTQWGMTYLTNFVAKDVELIIQAEFVKAKDS